MAVTNYYTVNGAIIGERSSAGRINYATDALGSVTGTLVNGQLQNTYAYKPYGALLAQTGPGADPTMQWAGSNGYRPTGRAQSDYYVRSRHCGMLAGRWTTVDPLWPHLDPYPQALDNPVTYTDPLGLFTGAPVVGLCPSCCCCPTGMTIDHVIDIDGVWKGNVGYGHHFQANFSYAYHLVDSNSGEVPGDCGLQWWEKTNHPYVKGEKVDHWYDQHAMLPNIDFWWLWNHREKPCPGSVTDFIPDTPLVIASDHPGTYIRFMCFLIAITKAPGCHCPDSGKKATAKQGLWVVNRKGYLRFFVTPSDDQIYSCKFP